MDIDKQLKAAGYHADANETLNFKRALEHVMLEVQTAPFSPLSARASFPIYGGVASTAKTFLYRQLAGVGEAAFVADYANDFPTVEAYGDEFPSVIKKLGAAYMYSIDDLAEASDSGYQIDSLKAMLARQAIEEKIDLVAWKGDAAHNIVGYLTAPGVASTAKVGVAWDNVAITPEIMIDDVDRAVATCFDATKGTFQKYTLKLPTKAFRAINQRQQSATFKGLSVAQFLLESNVFIDSIEHSAQLDSLGYMALYAKDPAVLGMILPQDFTQRAPQLQGELFKVHCVARTGGLVVRQPKACTYMTGIVATVADAGSSIG